MPRVAKAKSAAKDSTANLGFARPALDKHRLGKRIDHVGTIDRIGRDASPQASASSVPADGSASRPYPSKDLLGRVFEPSGARQTAAGSSQGERGGVHQFGVPPKGNANFAWVQHFIHHFAPQGMAGFVLANGSMSSNQSGEGEIRRALIEADLVDCMVALPGQLFYSTQIPVCLWFIARNKSGQPSPAASRHPLPVGEGRGEGKQLRDRRGETLFIDARKMGTLIDRVHRELTDADLEKIVSTYHAWRGDSSTKNKEPGTKNPTAAYADVAGFCKSATTAEIAAHGHVLTPGRYVGAEEVEDDGEPFEEKMARLVAELNGQFAESAKLETAIRKNLNGLGYAL